MTEFVDNSVFEFAQGREMVDDARATELLATCQNVVSPTTIRLSNKSFGFGAATLIADKLKNFSDVTVADISDIIAGRHEDEALQVLTTICDSLADKKLVEVNVSDNALGRKGVIACQGILKGKSMKKLYFCNNGLSAEASELISEILLEGGCPPLELLHFYNNMSGASGAIASARLVTAVASTLTDFRYSATRSSAEGCMAIAEALCNVTGLTRLDLSDNSFGGDVAEKLAAALTLQTNLEYLNLRDAGLGEEGLPLVFEALRTARPPLTHLDLSGNDLTEDMMEEFISVAEKLPTLSKVFLDDSELTVEAMTALSQAIRQKKIFQSLHTLSLFSCELTAAGAVQIARHVSRIPSFQQLLLDANQICTSGVEALEKIMEAADKTLGAMEDNDEDGDDDLADLEEDGEEGGGDDDEALESAMQGLSV